jgi:hypothetical protein
MKQIGIVAQRDSPDNRLFDTLGEILDLSFEERTFGDDRNVEAWIVLAADREFVSQMGRTNRPCYVVFQNQQLVPCGRSSKITFSTRPAAAAILAGREIETNEAIGLNALPRWLPNVAPVATKQESPVWAVQEAGRLRHHFVAMQVPALNDGEPLFTHFVGAQFLSLLPLWLFLQAVTEDQRWERPPLQATFMFDDPNLHWPTYGFVNFPETLQHANACNYHVSFATIPLDAWFVHPPTASLFKHNVQRLSLLFHGNDHLSDELARPYSVKRTRKVLQQALGRIAAMEYRTGLEVARVMAPPHGACSRNTLSQMAQVGFEAACVSRGSLHHHNKGDKWPLTIGMRPSDIIAGLPLFPRFALSDKCHNSILLAALLHQPIIPRAHHQDVAEGYQLLNDMATFVNSLGNVTWSDLKSISRSLYARMQDDTTLSVKMLTKRITIPIPPHISQIRIQCPSADHTVTDRFLWRNAGREPYWNSHPSQECLAVQPGTRLEVACVPGDQVSVDTNHVGMPGLIPLVRRLLTETRDRTLPPIHRITRRLRAR